MNSSPMKKSLTHLTSVVVLTAMLVGGVAHAACEHLFLGDARGATYSVRSAAVLGWMAQRRYDVEAPGLAEVKARGTRGILFVANHQSAVDGLIALGAFGGDLALRPILAAHRLGGPFGPVLKVGMKRFNGVAIPSVLKAGHSAYPTIHEVLDGIAAQLARDQNFYLLHNGFVQKTVADAPEAGRALYEILKRIPNVRVVLVRQRGSWGSRFSFAPINGEGTVRTNDLIARGLSQTLIDIPRSLIKPLPRRKITFTFEEPSDLPVVASRRELHRFLQEYFARVPESLNLVPRY